MQSLDVFQVELSCNVFVRTLEAIRDIADKVQIQSNFGISHVDYKPFELPAEVVERFQQVPLDLQEKYQNLQLRNFLYGIYYNGSLRSVLTSETTTDKPGLQSDLENNTFMGVDLGFYNQLHQSNQGRGYLDPDWLVLRQENDGSLAVHKEGLTLHLNQVDETTVKPLHPGQTTELVAASGNRVAIRLPANMVQNGFYMAIGNAGPQGHTGTEGIEIVRIYFNLMPSGAIAMMEQLTHYLNEIQIPFSFKALYNPSDYQRYDSAVLYFERCYYPKVRQILQLLYSAHQTYFQPEIPLFTKPLAPGLGLAEEPDQKFATQESFGMNRCQLIANGLLKAQRAGRTLPSDRLAAIVEQFSLMKLELDRPYLNANSEDVYPPLELC
jgi:hypothetical protein